MKRSILVLTILPVLGFGQIRDYRFFFGPTVTMPHFAVGLTGGYTFDDFGISISVRNNFGTASTSDQEVNQPFYKGMAEALGHERISDAQHVWGFEVMGLYAFSESFFPFLSLGLFNESIQLQYQDPLSKQDPNYQSPYGNRNGEYWIRDGRSQRITVGAGIFYEMNSQFAFQIGGNSLPDIVFAVLLRF